VPPDLEVGDQQPSKNEDGADCERALHGRVSSVQRFSVIVETTGHRAEPPKFMTPAEKTLAPAAVV
jgi:hypothetical protein